MWKENEFKTFVKDYLDIVKFQRLSFVSYELEKYRLCRHFLYTWLVILFVNNKENYNFDTKDVFKIFFKKYCCERYLYPILFLICCIKIIG